MADEQFQVLKFEKDALRKQLSAQGFKFSSSTELNIDTFMSFSEVHFSSRDKSYRYSKLLMKELLAHGIGFKEIIESYEKVLIHLLDFEQQLGLSLSQEEALRILLCLNNQSIFAWMREHPLICENIEMINKWREIINH